MAYEKHVCGYPIWIHDREKATGWIRTFKDEPDGTILTRCPGCGGKLIHWEIAKPNSLRVPSYRKLLADLVERVEALLYHRHPEEAEQWKALTRDARGILEDTETELAPAPWETDD